MKHFLQKVVYVIPLTLILLGTTSVHAQSPQTPQQYQQPSPGIKQVKLSDPQKAELAKLHKQMIKDKTKIIEKYVSYGILSKAQGQMIIAHMERRYEKLEQNGFLPTGPHHGQMHHSWNEQAR
ncbi:YckD family protein [Terrilactibacillus laevilacticus]|uniref:YckD family protein n=1 Tax=Terrilactibacillus laevilacticus TaxID=1380157 RepID=A0ABW5PQV4_9BACI|nr:YckD family protein [Terrilactibacillus laevilacticus]